MALSYASPTEPIEGRTPASRQRWPNSIELYWGIQVVVATGSGALPVDTANRPCICSPLSTRFGVVAFHPVGNSTLDKHSAVLGLVRQPTLRAGAASGILDKTKHRAMLVKG